MGVIEDILSTVRKGPELMAKVNDVKLNTKSVAQGAKDATFQFPFIVPNSCPNDMANSSARMLDQVYASFVQTWLSVNPMFDMTIDPSPLSYLKRFHQNIKFESGIENLEIPESEVDTYIEKVYNGEYRLYMNESKDFGILFNAADNFTKEMLDSHKEYMKEYMSDFDLNPLEEVKLEADELDNSKLDPIDAFINGEVKNSQIKRQRDLADSTSKSQAPKLLDRDVKRSNDMVPYAIQVRLIAVNDKKEFVQYVDFIVGVKAVLHLIDSDDMVENLVRVLQNKSVMFKLLRWTTGEISLAKDIILNINDIKADVINKNNGKSPFFSVLKRLKDKKLSVRNVTVPHALIPNATILVTSYEVEYMQREYGIDLRNPVNAKKIIDNLFLMTFIIMDEGTNTLSILYRDESTYQTYSLETIERDTALNSNKLGREIGRMISHT